MKCPANSVPKPESRRVDDAKGIHARYQVRPGWDVDRVRPVLEQYEARTDEEAVAEGEDSYQAITQTTMGIPVELAPAVRALIAKRQAE